jgi:hypothetical protein
LLLINYRIPEDSTLLSELPLKGKDQTMYRKSKFLGAFVFFCSLSFFSQVFPATEATLGQEEGLEFLLFLDVPVVTTSTLTGNRCFQDSGSHDGYHQKRI